MFETSGIIDRNLIMELQEKDMPRLNKITLGLFVILLVLALRYPFGSHAFTISLLCSALPFLVRVSLIRNYIQINLGAIKNLTGGRETLEVGTVFHDDHVIMSLPDGTNPVVIPYEELHRILVTPSVYCISSVNHNGVYVFRNQLSPEEQKELFAFLKQKDTKIPENQFPESF